jgi:hypothetical protein
MRSIAEIALFQQPMQHYHSLFSRIIQPLRMQNAHSPHRRTAQELADACIVCHLWNHGAL